MFFYFVTSMLGDCIKNLYTVRLALKNTRSDTGKTAAMSTEIPNHAVRRPEGFDAQAVLNEPAAKVARRCCIFGHADDKRMAAIAGRVALFSRRMLPVVVFSELDCLPYDPCAPPRPTPIFRRSALATLARAVHADAGQIHLLTSLNAADATGAGTRLCPAKCRVFRPCG